MDACNTYSFGQFSSQDPQPLLKFLPLIITIVVALSISVNVYAASGSRAGSEGLARCLKGEAP